MKRGLIISSLRRLWLQSTERTEAKRESRISRGVYKCCRCEGCFKDTEIQIHHTIPVIDPIEGFTSWDKYIQRLYCDRKDLEALCKTCHNLEHKKP